MRRFLFVLGVALAPTVLEAEGVNCSKRAFYVQVPTVLDSLPAGGVRVSIGSESWMRSGRPGGKKVMLEDWCLLVVNPRTGAEVDVKSRAQLKRLVGRREVHARIAPAGTPPSTSGSITFANPAAVLAARANTEPTAAAELARSVLDQRGVLGVRTVDPVGNIAGRLEVAVSRELAGHVADTTPAVLVRVTLDDGKNRRQVTLAGAFRSGPPDDYVRRELIARRAHQKEALTGRYTNVQEVADGVQVFTKTVGIGVAVGAVPVSGVVALVTSFSLVPEPVGVAMDVIDIADLMLTPPGPRSTWVKKLHDWDTDRSVEDWGREEPIPADDVFNRDRGVVTAVLPRWSGEVCEVSFVEPDYATYADAQAALLALCASHNFNEVRTNSALERLEMVADRSDLDRTQSRTTDAVVRAVALSAPPRDTVKPNTGTSRRARGRRRFAAQTDRALDVVSLDMIASNRTSSAARSAWMSLSVSGSHRPAVGRSVMTPKGPSLTGSPSTGMYG